mgnify:FL=1
MHFGYTLEEAKLVYKQVNESTYYYEKKGRQFIRSSADLNTAEMTKTIDKFRQKSADAGFPLPSAEDREWLDRIDIEISRNSYL